MRDIIKKKQRAENRRTGINEKEVGKTAIKSQQGAKNVII
jgi:hypothetical protein